MGPIRAIFMILLSPCMTAICGPARADLFRDTLSVCSSRLDNHLAYQQALENIGWVEVTGPEGTAIIDRINWLPIPMVKRSELDRAGGLGLTCHGHDLCVPTSLGRSEMHPTALTQAFKYDDNALLMYSRLGDRRNSEAYLTDVLNCEMVTPAAIPHAELRDAVSVTKLPPSDPARAGSYEYLRLTKLNDFQQRETGVFLEDYSGDGLHYGDKLPWTSVERFVYLTDPEVLEDLNLEWLNYASGFSTNITHLYEGTSP